MTNNVIKLISDKFNKLVLKNKKWKNIKQVDQMLIDKTTTIQIWKQVT